MMNALALLAEREREFGERFLVRARPGVFVPFDDDLLALEFGLDRHDLIVVPALVPGLLPAPLRVDGDPVEFRAREVVVLRDALSPLALRGQFVEVLEIRVGQPVAVRPHRDTGHVFDPAGDEDVVLAGHDVRRREVGRLLARAAHSIELYAGDDIAPAGDHGRESPDIEPLLAHWRHTAVDDIFDRPGLEPVALAQGRKRFGGQILWVRVLERAVAFPERRSDGIDDDCGVHDVSSSIPPFIIDVVRVLESPVLEPLRRYLSRSQPCTLLPAHNN